MRINLRVLLFVIVPWLAMLAWASTYPEEIDSDVVWVMLPVFVAIQWALIDHFYPPRRR